MTKLEKLVLNKNLLVNKEDKKVIINAEGGRYGYFDFSKETIQEIANKELKEVKFNEWNSIIQALFPKHLICSGLFDCFLMFNIKNDKRVDPPKYYYRNLSSYLNNDEKSQLNKLNLEIKDLFIKNNIKWDNSWNNFFEVVEV